MSFRSHSRVYLAGLFVSRALAAAPADDWDKPPPRAVSPHIPPAARGFQAAVRSGVSLPWGNAARGDALSARNGWQLPAILDAGFKLNKPLYAGVYLGVGYGSSGESPRLAEICAQSGFACSVLSYQLGVQAQYHFGASEVFNPFVGYGLGYEIVEQSLETDGYSETQTSSGFTFLKASFGVDYRSSALVGLGPFVEVSAGRFSSAETTVGDASVYRGPVEESDWHGYLTFGVRMVLFP